MDVGANSLTSVVALCRKGQKSQKLASRPNKSLQCQTRSKRPKMSQNFQKAKPKISRPRAIKKAKFNLFGPVKHIILDSAQETLGVKKCNANVMDSVVGCYAYGNMFCWL